MSVKSPKQTILQLFIDTKLSPRQGFFITLILLSYYYVITKAVNFTHIHCWISCLLTNTTSIPDLAGVDVLFFFTELNMVLHKNTAASEGNSHY